MATTPRWLLLVHQLPSRASNARVKTWRRLQQLGALPTRNAVYVLPNTESCREDFEWIRGEIVSLGGEATVFVADALGTSGDEAIVLGFQRAREADYRAFIRKADQLGRYMQKTRRFPSSKRDAASGAVRALQQRLSAIERVDFCQAPGRDEAVAAIAKLQVAAPGLAKPRVAAGALSLAAFRGRRWVTRPRPGVDRMASAWLIRRFVDPDAVFAFVDRATGSDVPFDMYEGDFSHQGSKCTFEVLIDRFRLDAPVLERLAHVVHDLDIKDARYGPPEAATMGRMVEGLREAYADDQVLLTHGITMFEALARSFEAEARPSSSSAKSRATPRKSKRDRR